MSFIRPELQTTLWRWREVIGAGLVAAIGLWWGLHSFGVVRYLGYALVVLAAAYAVAAVQRVRFHSAGQGPGVVQVDERRLSYFGPLTGGIIELGDLAKVALEPKSHPAPHWILTAHGGQEVAIPVNAAGAEALFDVFAALPGIQTERMLDVLSRTPDARVTVWEAPQRRLH